MTPARDYALSIIDQIALPFWSAGAMRRRRKTIAVPEDPRDRALAEHLYIGVVKNLLHLQFLLARLAGRNLRSIDLLVQKIAAIGLYQLRFMTRIPAHAAVDEAVEQARRLGRARACGFVNAVLRKAAQADVALPDPAVQADLYARQVLSHPRDLFGRLASLFGTDDALRICEHNNSQPPTVVRLMAGASPQALLGAGVPILEHQQPGMYIVQITTAALLADWAARGIAQAQDPTAALAVEAMDLSPGQVVLDRCCGAGTKTLQIVENVGPTGLVVAMDPSVERCEMLSRMLAARGVSNVRVRPAGMIDKLGPADPREFDRILIDVPCSNSGVLARRPEARYAQTDRAIASLSRLQDRILADAAGALRPGGRLVYSTCSLWPEENQQRVEAFLANHSSYRLVDQKTTLPSLDSHPTRYRDGGYCAVLKRSG